MARRLSQVLSTIVQPTTISLSHCAFAYRVGQKNAYYTLVHIFAVHIFAKY